jgi:uncharacterized protein
MPKTRTNYDCTDCPAYCCSQYERVAVSNRDLKRLALHHALTLEEAAKRFTRMRGEERVLRRSKDPLLGEACKFLDRETRGCTIYHSRPTVCREYPGEYRCVYYDVLKFERRVQEDPDVVPLFQITFPAWKRKVVEPPV